FVSGGATTQQALLPLNFAAPGQRADYVLTGHWGQVATRQARPYVDLHVAASAEDSGYTRIPPPSGWRLSRDAAYVHVTASETIHGAEVRPAARGAHPFPATGGVPLFSAFGGVQAGPRKNLGPVGIGVVVVGRDLLERAGQPRADIFDYRLQLAAGSMLNTPPTWNWYVAGLTFRWMLEQGGVEAFARRN